MTQRRKTHKHPKYLQLLLLSNLANNFGFAVFAPLYGVYILELGAEPEIGSYIWASYTFLTAILLLVFGKLENGSKNKLKTICVGNVFQLCGAITILLFTSLPGLLGGLLLYGSGTAILGPAWYYLYSNHLNKKRGTEEWSWNSSGSSFAIAAGAGLGGVVIARYSFEGVLACMVASCLVGLFCIFKLYRSSL